jgi:hypothetical protein
VDSTLVAADASANSVQARTPLRQLPDQSAAALTLAALLVRRTDPNAALIRDQPRHKARLRTKVHVAADGRPTPHCDGGHRSPSRPW